MSRELWRLIIDVTRLCYRSKHLNFKRDWVTLMISLPWSVRRGTPVQGSSSEESDSNRQSGPPQRQPAGEGVHGNMKPFGPDVVAQEP